jgi:thymidylate synthase (FAD)
MLATYIDHMGDDLRVVNAARVSFNKIKDEFAESDGKLISYLARHNHWTPFSHPQITILEKVPIFIARQRFKHTVGFTYNEVSRRYVDEQPTFYKPQNWRGRPEGSIKQGSAGALEKERQEYLSVRYDDLMEQAQWTYERFLVEGVAPEQARMLLPQAMFTEYYVTGSLSAWARAYKQRIDPHAQLEIAELAGQWDKIIKPLFPVCWSALTE